MVEVWFIALLLIAFYAYLGYGMLIYLLVKILGKDKMVKSSTYFPSVSLIVPCYNEGKGLREKILNTLELSYPEGLLEIIFICDGSEDGSQTIPLEFPEVKTMYSAERKGKLAAMKRAVRQASGNILVFCDANTRLNKKALEQIVQPYHDRRVGAVSGEKSILSSNQQGAGEKGEGMYWKYESFLKKYDSFLYTLVGAAGELISCRMELFQDLPDNTILDDFMLSMKIAEAGYRVKYVPEAIASEYASANVGEEVKRKIRIAAGGWQSMFRLRKAINPFHDPVLTFQYVSHRVLRWALIPFLLIVLLLLNHYLAIQTQELHWYMILGMQYMFYLWAWWGYRWQYKEVSIKGFFVPYYFTVMNLCAILGFFRWLKGAQPSTWEKAIRIDELSD
ncbi:glycosyltransferase family 2 protein [Algoriphagus sp. AGSA1]|uniref:glycosyltransferase family 2 protein n=1 Tax=Algoriphagus sp. AGSA1 TaxID=2907213 RepID=UPI001F1C55AB|nr:glycosyltransferase family 2 protein [Algoriphagus sp. AGSA1]MCE7053737.1 glycosyltransferase family 2 protein [Algoriphagus sp. AGSA1]